MIGTNAFGKSWLQMSYSNREVVNLPSKSQIPNKNRKFGNNKIFFVFYVQYSINKISN